MSSLLCMLLHISTLWLDQCIVMLRQEESINVLLLKFWVNQNLTAIWFGTSMGRKHSGSSIYPQLGQDDTAILVSDKLKVDYLRAHWERDSKILVVHIYIYIYIYMCVCARTREFFINIVFLRKNLFILICKLRLIVIANGKSN